MTATAERISVLTAEDHDVLEVFLEARTVGRLWLTTGEVVKALGVNHEAHRPWRPLELLNALQIIQLVDFGGEQGYVLDDPDAVQAGLRKAGRFYASAEGPRSRPSPLAEGTS
jgi:hypothetical protein